MLELLRSSRKPVAVPEPDAGADAADEEAPPKAPWHFKVMLVALVVYLAWRGVQGIDWIAQRL